MELVRLILKVIAVAYNIWVLYLFGRQKFETIIYRNPHLFRIDAYLFEKSVRLVSHITLLRKD